MMKTQDLFPHLAVPSLPHLWLLLLNPSPAMWR